MPEDIDYFEGKRPDRTYISRPFDVDVSFEDTGGRRARIVSKVFDSPELHEFVQVKEEVVLRVTPGRRQEVKATFYEDTRQIKSLTIQRYTRRTGKPHRRTHFTFSGKEIDRLYKLLRVIRFLSLDKQDKARLDDEILEDLFISGDEKRRFFLQNIDLVREIAESDITTHDVVALAYRKRQLQIFERLLDDPSFMQSRRRELGLSGKEAVWQHFFEENSWIFGYGLNYIFMSGLDERKLEQITTGHQLTHAGKRIDALMKTRGLISSLCFIEIKTHETELLHPGESYRSASWRISADLAGSIAQIQRTLQLAVKTIQSKIEFVGSEGDPTGEIAFLYEPKAYVVIGSLDEFISDSGINELKFSSFEMFRRNLSNPEIITYDELLSRARFIVRQTEGLDHTQVPEERCFDDDNIPF